MATIHNLNNQLASLQLNSESGSFLDQSAIDGNVNVPFDQFLQHETDLNEQVSFTDQRPSDFENTTENMTEVDIEQKTSEATHEIKLNNKSQVKPTVGQGSNEGGDKKAVAHAKEASKADAADTSKKAIKVKHSMLPGKEVSESADKTKAAKNQPATAASISKSSTKSASSNTASSNIASSNTASSGNSVQAVTRATNSTPSQNLQSTTPVASDTSQGNSIAQLKTDVKAIFKNLTSLKATTTNDTSVSRSNILPGETTRALSIDKVKPIRLTTTPLAQENRTRKGKTTVQHLTARNNARLDTSGTQKDDKSRLKSANNSPVNNAVVKNAEETVINPRMVAAQKAKIKAKATIDLEQAPQNASKTKTAKGRKRMQAIQAAKNSLERSPQTQKTDTPSTIMRDAVAQTEANAAQNMTNQTANTEMVKSDGASADSGNNLFARSEAGQQSSQAKTAAKTAQTFSSRSMAWVKNLTNKTAQLNRQNPNWKVLEMKLDQGDGNVTIKVRHEDEQVKISVQFSDDSLRAHAESQSSQIIEHLKEQYGKDVSFTFAEKQESPFNSAMDKREIRRRRTSTQVEATDKTAQPQQYGRVSPDQNIWIG